MGKFIDMTGWIMKEHGVPNSRLTVIRRGEDKITPTGRACICWECVCECGSDKTVVIDGNSLRHGLTQSCGCLKREKTIEANKKYNKYNLDGEYGIGWSSNTNREFYFDLEDYEKIKDYCWCEIVTNTGFHRLTANVNGVTTAMHILLGFKGCDHEDRNELNNRKSNLRECTHIENMRNSSLYKNNTSGVTGVHWCNKDKRWVASIAVDKKLKRIGGFINKEDAIKARLKAEFKYFKDFAPQKHLFQTYGVIEEERDNE